METRTGPPPLTRAKSQIAPHSQQNIFSRTKPATSLKAQAKHDPFHVMHKVPFADTPYGRAKHLQLVEKEPEGAIAWFWKAIHAGDRVDSALKDMAIVLKQQNRPLEAIEAIKSYRHRCCEQAQESLDNVLIDLYKKCGRLDEQIELLKHKLRLIQQGAAFSGKATKTARSHGKKFQLSIKQETTRLLGNLGWAYMQQLNYGAAEIVYRKAQLMDPDDNKACNLSICLMKQRKLEEAAAILEAVLSCNQDPKCSERAKELLNQIRSSGVDNKGIEIAKEGSNAADMSMAGLEESLEWCWRWAGESWGDTAETTGKRNRLRVFEQMTAAALKEEVVAF